MARVTRRVRINPLLHDRPLSGYVGGGGALRVSHTWTRLLVAAAALWACAPAQATTINVTTQLDVSNPSDGQCSLREAIGAQANKAASGSAAGECPAGSADSNTILLPAGLYPVNGVLGFY